MSALAVRPLAGADRAWTDAQLRASWGGTLMATRGRLHDLGASPGFVATLGGARIALATYRLAADGCELLSLDSLREGQGAGTALLAAGCRRLCRSPPTTTPAPCAPTSGAASASPPSTATRSPPRASSSRRSPSSATTLSRSATSWSWNCRLVERADHRRRAARSLRQSSSGDTNPPLWKNRCTRILP